MTRIAALLALLLPVLTATLPATPVQAAERITRDQVVAILRERVSR